jgi:prepilin-type N-terminal cleavage/methylation domain-containing protein
MRSRLASSESGFTLIEVLVVILIIGILSAIALVMFTSQRDKGQDANAKSNASELVAAVDRCYVDTQDFTLCDGQGANDKLGTTGLPIGSGPGQVSVTSATGISFTVTSVSSGGHHFVVQQGADGVQNRSCDAGSPGTSGGGCNNSTW